MKNICLSPPCPTSYHFNIFISGYWGPSLSCNSVMECSARAAILSIAVFSNEEVAGERYMRGNWTPSPIGQTPADRLLGGTKQHQFYNSPWFREIPTFPTCSHWNWGSRKHYTLRQRTEHQKYKFVSNFSLLIHLLMKSKECLLRIIHGRGLKINHWTAYVFPSLIALIIVLITNCERNCVIESKNVGGATGLAFLKTWLLKFCKGVGLLRAVGKGALADKAMNAKSLRKDKACFQNSTCFRGEIQQSG